MNARRTLSILGILLLTVLVGALGPGPAGAINFSVENLTQSPETESQLAVAEGAAVWVSGMDTASEIWLYDLSGGPGALPEQITENEARDAAPEIEGSNVVWQCEEAYDDWWLYGYDIATPEPEPTRLTQLYQDSEVPEEPLTLTDSEWVVWVEYAPFDELLALAEADGEEGIPVICYARTDGESEPQILDPGEFEIYPEINSESIRLEDSRLVMEFKEFDGESEEEKTRICYADLREEGEEGEGAALRRIDPAPAPGRIYDERNPSFDGDRVTWVRDYEEDESEMYRAILTEEEPELEGEPIAIPYEASSPLIEGDRMIWVGDDGYDTEIYYCDLSNPEDVRQLTDNTHDDFDPFMADEKVVWCGTGSDSEIYYYDLTWELGTEALRLTDNALEDTSPRIAGERVLWLGELEDGTTDVFAATILAEEITYAYDYTCRYANGDWYRGTVYAAEGTYEVGEKVFFTDENGERGKYRIFRMAPADEGTEGEVFVRRYYDKESDYKYKPLHFGTAVGAEGLGSERDYLLLNGYVLNRFGIGPEGAEEVHYEADVTEAQDVYNRLDEPFRSIHLGNLHRCYILLGTIDHDLFDDAV